LSPRPTITPAEYRALTLEIAGLFDMSEITTKGPAADAAGAIAEAVAGAPEDAVTAAGIVGDIEEASSSSRASSPLDTASASDDEEAVEVDPVESRAMHGDTDDEDLLNYEDPQPMEARSAKRRAADQRIADEFDRRCVEPADRAEVIEAIAAEFDVDASEVERIVDEAWADGNADADSDSDVDDPSYEPDADADEDAAPAAKKAKIEGAGDTTVPPPKRKLDADADAAPAAKKPRKTRTTHPRLVQGLCDEATTDGKDVTETMEEAGKWIRNTKPHKGAKCVSYNDGFVVVTDGACFMVETVNPTVDKCVQAVPAGGAVITVDDSDSDCEPDDEPEPETKPETKPTGGKPTLRQRACGHGSVNIGSMAMTDFVMCTGGRQVKSIKFDGLFVSEAAMVMVDGEQVFHRTKTVAFKTDESTAEAFVKPLGPLITRLTDALRDGNEVRFHVGPQAHPEIQALALEIKDRLVDYGKTVVATEHDDFVNRITDPALINALIEDPSMALPTLETIIAYMLIGGEYARVFTKGIDAATIEWEQSPEEAFTPAKILEAVACIRAPTTSANGALATWNAISDRAPDATTLSECFPPGAITDSLELIRATAMQMYAIIQAGSFKEQMLEYRQQVLALEDGAAKPTSAEVTVAQEDDAGGTDVVEIFRAWLDDHDDEARERARDTLRPVTHTKHGTFVAVQSLTRLAEWERTEAIEKRAAGPEETLVHELAKLALADACKQGIADGEMADNVVEATAERVLAEVYVDEPVGIGAALRLLISTYYIDTLEAKQKATAERLEAAQANAPSRTRKRNQKYSDAAPAPKRR
jgi:hypothetical protein